MHGFGVIFFKLKLLLSAGSSFCISFALIIFIFNYYIKTSKKKTVLLPEVACTPLHYILDLIIIRTQIGHCYGRCVCQNGNLVIFAPCWDMSSLSNQFYSLLYHSHPFWDQMQLKEVWSLNEVFEFLLFWQDRDRQAFVGPEVGCIAPVCLKYWSLYLQWPVVWCLAKKTLLELIMYAARQKLNISMVEGTKFWEHLSKLCFHRMSTMLYNYYCCNSV